MEMQKIINQITPLNFNLKYPGSGVTNTNKQTNDDDCIYIYIYIDAADELPT